MKKLEYCFRCGAELQSKFYEGRERYYCSECDEIRYRNSVPVAGVFVVRENEVLLIKRLNNPFIDKWSYPAGYLEFDEKPETGAARELEEETGLDVDESDLELVSTILLEHPDKFVVGNAYAVDFSETGGEIRAGDDAEEARFFTVDQMRRKATDMESPKIIEAAEDAIELVNSDR